MSKRQGETDEILGFSAIGTQAGELMSVVQTAIARQASIHRFARRNLRSPNDGGGTHRVVCGSARRARKSFERSCGLRKSL
jgi:hypothetical protein